MNDTIGNNEQEIVEMSVEIPDDLIDVVRDFITEQICLGQGLEEQKHSENTYLIFYVAPSEFVTSKNKIIEYLSDLTDNPLQPIPEITHRVLHKSDWEEQYRLSVQPVMVTDEIIVRPPWSEPSPAIPFEIIIEPKMAFGTGRHETTNSCLRIIRDRLKPGICFLDVGCGSGILSILADKLKAGYIKAVDYDPDAVENCRENFIINNVQAKYDIELGSIEKCAGDTPYGFICANIIKNTILELLPSLNNLLTKDGLLVLSGLLLQDIDEVSLVLKKLNLTIIEIVADQEWRTMVVTKN